MASFPAFMSLQNFLSSLPTPLHRTELDTCHHIAINIGNISQLLKHSPSPQCPNNQAHIPRPTCPTPDVPIPRAAIIPLIDQTIALCQAWRVNPQATELADNVEERMSELRAYAGDNLVALELKVLKALERPTIAAEQNGDLVSLEGNSDDRFYELSAKQAGLPVSRYMQKLERGKISFGADGKPVAMTKKAIKKAGKARKVTIVLSNPPFAKSQLAKLKGNELKKRIEADLKEQGIAASIGRFKISKS
ncbi:MAG: hypothetical protein Q9223_001506, partial [Gallowayella weberi]